MKKLSELTLENLKDYSFDEIFNSSKNIESETFVIQDSYPAFDENDLLFHTICFDGFALLNNGLDKVIYLVTYPKLSNLSNEQITIILEYCGFDNRNDIDIFSIYLTLGKEFKIV
jgi:hypothetical protein